MGTTLYRVDVVDIAVDILRIVGIVHHGNLDRNALLLGLEIDNIVEKVSAVTVNITHKLLQTLLGMEHFLAGVTLLVGTEVLERYGDAGIEVSQLTHTFGDDLIFVDSSGEDATIGPELLTCTLERGLTYDLHGIEGFTFLILLLIDLSVAEHL